jgi:hypothetical protein
MHGKTDCCQYPSCWYRHDLLSPYLLLVHNNRFFILNEVTISVIVYPPFFFTGKMFTWWFIIVVWFISYLFPDKTLKFNFDHSPKAINSLITQSACVYLNLLPHVKRILTEIYAGTKTKPFLKRKMVQKFYFHFGQPKKRPPFSFNIYLAMW